MAKNMGFDPKRVEYVHRIGESRAGVHINGRAGQFIEIDSFAFNRAYVRSAGGHSWRSVLAHEIGHVRGVPGLRSVTPRVVGEYWADVFGAGARGLPRADQAALINRGLFQNY